MANKMTIELAVEGLRKYCVDTQRDFNTAKEKICAIGNDYALLCVPNPKAPQADGLKNDAETIMLPVLYIRISENGTYAEETEYTSEYLV